MTISAPIGIEEIKKHIPHRPPMLLVDEVVSFEKMRIQTKFRVKSNADYLQGHFPNMPIQPGVLIVETVAQTGALLVKLSHGLPQGMFMGFSGIDNAKFKKPVYPDETMIVDLEIIRKRLPFYKFSAKVSVKDKLVALVEFSAAHMLLKEKEA